MNTPARGKSHLGPDGLTDRELAWMGALVVACLVALTLIVVIAH